MRKKFKIISWALYDLANQFFALNVVSIYFPLWLIDEKGIPEIFLSISFGISVFVAAIIAPVLGAIADMGQRKKEFLLFFTFLSIVFTVALGQPMRIVYALVFFAIANLGCQAATVFYNSLIVDVTDNKQIGLISGIGRMFGYSGAIVALLLTKPVAEKYGYQATFVTTGILFFLFSLPCLFFVKEKPRLKPSAPITDVSKKGLVEIFLRLKNILYGRKANTSLRYFLFASFFGLCVVNTMILYMAVYLKKAYAIDNVEQIVAFSTVFAILGSLFSGILSDRIGPRRCLVGIFVLWIVCLIGGSLARPPFHWIIGAMAGLSLGATWVVARALAVSLVVKEKITEVFAFFNIVAYAAGIIGSLWWGLLVLGLASLGELGYRLTVCSLNIFVVLGIIMLKRMPDRPEKITSEELA